MKLSKLALTSAVALFGFTAVACGGDTMNTITLDPSAFKPPMGLVAMSGDQSVTLMWQSANSDEDEVDLQGFSIYMAETDLTAEADADEPAPLATRNAAFDSAGDGVIDCLDEEEDSCNKALPVAFIADQSTDQEVQDGSNETRDLTLEVPGTVTYTMTTGDSIPAFNDDGSLISAGGDASADDAAADDAADDAPADDEAARSSYAQDATDETTDGGGETGTGGGTITLTNGTEYSFIVSARGDDDLSVESWTSNVAATAPRADLGSFQLDANVTTANALDIDGAAVVGFTSLTGDYDDGTAADLVIENYNNFYQPGQHNYFASTNGNLGIQDVGFVDDWADVLQAPGGGFIAAGRSVLVVNGHLYVVALADGTYAKVLVTGDDAAGGTVDVTVAYQDSGSLYFK